MPDPILRIFEIEEWTAVGESLPPEVEFVHLKHDLQHYATLGYLTRSRGAMGWRAIVADRGGNLLGLGFYPLDWEAFTHWTSVN